jgi:hypothetical protein
MGVFQPWKDSGMSEKLDEKMSAIDWAVHIEVIAGPFGGNRKGWLSRAARKSGATFRQVKALYYGECTNPKTDVAMGVLAAAEKARKEASDQASRFESLAGAMNASDPDFYSADVLALIHAARALRGLDRT